MIFLQLTRFNHSYMNAGWKMEAADLDQVGGPCMSVPLRHNN